MVQVPAAEEDDSEAITEAPPKKKSANPPWEKNTPSRKSEDEDDESYGVQNQEEEDEEERPKKKKKKKKKRYDDDDDDRPRRRYPPHRAGSVLTYGILAMVCCIPLVSWYLAFTAINMANEDLAEMSARRMDPAGQGVTQMGRVFGYIGAVLAVGWLILGIALRVSDATK